VSDLLRLSHQHAVIQRLLLVGDSVARFKRHIASCQECRLLAARLGAVDGLLMEAPAPRPALFDEIVEQTTQRGRASASAPGVHGPAGVDVLLVDNDRSVVEMYRTRLEMDGCHVAVARNGETAHRSLCELAPKLLVLEYRMGGGALLRALPSEGRTQVVVLSSSDEPALIDEARGLGARAWLVKSQTMPADLSAQVRRLLSLKVIPGTTDRP
jgi:CheY-like chemotaxis protein